MFFGQKQQPSSAQPQLTTPKDPKLEPMATSPTMPSNQSMMTKNRQMGSGFGNSNNNNNMMVRGERLPQVPVTIKPMNTPTDKENFETELISKSLILITLVMIS